MKANLTNLRKALKACAKAHKVQFCNWVKDGQLGLKSESVPVVSDVRMISEAFFGTTIPSAVEPAHGYTTVWLCYDFLLEVNEDLLKLALPYGTQL